MITVIQNKPFQRNVFVLHLFQRRNISKNIISQGLKKVVFSFFNFRIENSELNNVKDFLSILLDFPLGLRDIEFF